MDYLKFDKSQLVNTEYSLKKEFIRTNRAGSFASSTIINCNTRKYHGMLICPIENFSGENYVLLSALDETIIQHDTDFHLGIHKFPGEYSPKGHKYIRKYEMDPMPAITYRVGGVVLKKEFLLVEKEQRLLIRYSLLDAHSPTVIRLQPFLAFRNIHELTKANLDANTRAEVINNGIRSKLYEGFPYLHMQTSKKSEFIHVPDWYYNVEYKEEKKRGYDCHEDLFVPGYFEMEIQKGESIVFCAGTKEIAPNVINRQFNSELKKRVKRDSFENCLENSADQFISRKGRETTIINGFPWFSTSERNTYLSLPGLTLARGDEKTFLAVLNTSYKHLCDRFSSDRVLSKGKASVDVPLWFIWALQKYVEYGADKKNLWKKYGKKIKEIFQHYKFGSNLAIKMNENGLLWTIKQGVTWMNIQNNGTFLNRRMGYVVEINALWYNAICFALDLAAEAKDHLFVSDWEDVPVMVKESFLEVFWDKDKKYLADYIDDSHKSWAVRPNQLFAASLPYSCLSKEQKKSILDLIEKELVTSRGLRSLSPKNHEYVGVFQGNETQRNNAFHYGSVFPWLFGHFANAYLALYKSGGESRIQRLLNNFEDCLNEHGLGSISEIYDGNPPHRPNEATSYALSVAEIIRVNKMLQQPSKID
ncbi:glycogen debranching enzyme N-terminal domain-containing protein [Ancylomarina longa]|uniref:Amylo-alpha-1,6-glucosidase n=1 Tax=Ancylomarina longa TaxID=2487017 RepID=A0A434AZK3_9BACT|nr:glycogen debranching enzyme N-terminal domain-containing protein [Ancylomarina longa]RUT79964.1 amylo-alpha-1,6-glucosidase [Ancylomarina longa]